MDYEIIPEQEEAQIQHIVELTRRQLQGRYPSPAQMLRGVHAKDHGCVDAVFRINDGLPGPYKLGLFAYPGLERRALVRFSNAATLVKPDSTTDPETGKPAHGSRGMAVKVFDVETDAATGIQDFLMVNHPVFAFANVEDYEVLSEVILATFDPETHSEDARPFFARQLAKGGDAAARAQVTLGIVQRIKAASVSEGAFQEPPSHPAQNQYFSGAPFLFGTGKAMKYRTTPVDEPVEAPPEIADASYLRNGLKRRLDPSVTGKPVVFRFSVQVRDVGSLNVAKEIEDATTEWDEQIHPFVDVATISIPPQDFDSQDAQTRCESSFFTPWHTLECFRPLGGINRLRRGVYEASMNMRLGNADG